MKIEPRELVIAMLLFLLSTTVLTFSKFSTEIGYGDNAFLTQLSENMGRNGVAESNVSQAIRDFLSSGLLSSKSEVFLKYVFGAATANTESYLKFHSYFVLFLLIPFFKLFNANLILNIVHVASFTSLILVIYLTLREKKVEIVPALIVCFLISSHPAWGQSITGQLYVDRYFIGFAGVYAYFLTRERKHPLLIFLFGLLCSVVSERTGVIIGIFTIGWILLNWKQATVKFRMEILAFGIGFALFSLFLIKIYIHNDTYNGYLPANLTDLLSRLADDRFSSNLKMFLLLNVFVYGIIALYSWRLYILSIVTMLPNMVGNYGGAEKTGFLTHYHSLYLPILAFALVYGFIGLYNRFSDRLTRIGLAAIVMVLALVGVNLYPYNWKSIDLFQNPLHGYAVAKYLSPEVRKERSSVIHLKRFFETELPKNVIVSTPESYMPLVMVSREIYYYPMGIDIADYVVLNFTMDQKGTKAYYGAFNSWLGSEETKKIDIVLNGRLLKDGYDLDHPVIYGNIAILKRPKQQ
jgi:hypothetical protein